MSILDQILQDQEAAKAALAAALNQKAFDVLDSFSSNEEYEVVTFEDEDTNESIEGLAEGLGSLAGLSKHLIKTVTAGRAYGIQGAGEHSEVESHAIKNKSGHRAILNKALDAGHVPVVYVNGKIHSAGKSNDSSYGRPDYAIHSGDEQQTQRQVTYPKPWRSGGKMHYPEAHVGQNPHYSKGDALEKLTPGHEASFYKDNKVEVKIIHPDKERQKLHAARTNARPETQTNYVNTVPGDKRASQYVDGKTKTSVTSAGDNLKSIKTAAALKLATQKLGGSDASANKKAMDLHAELGQHLAKGNHREAINTANKLADHVRNQGLSTHADKIADYAKNLKDLKSRYDKSYAKRNLARLRGEKVDESEELTEALEAMLVEMLDTNEAVVGGSVKKDRHGNILRVKTVPDSHRASVIPGSVKKDKDGNIVSMKTE